jgi:hypothetical protein
MIDALIITVDTVLPFHPGAVRYYREIGVSIPEALVPPLARAEAPTK